MTANRRSFLVSLVLAVAVGHVEPDGCLAQEEGTGQVAAPLMRLEDDQRVGRLTLHRGIVPLWTYVYRDPAVTRPYFTAVRTLSGRPVTRRHPPGPTDSQDHASMHPGLWQSFGDVSGNDYWRLQAATRHDRFLNAPQVSDYQVTFTVRNHFLLTGTDKVHCVEDCDYRVRLVDGGYLLTIDSRFTPAGEKSAAYFGDQEEMGLAVRVATSMAVTSGGTIHDAKGRVQENQIWGKLAPWCDYSGPSGDGTAGVALISHPMNEPLPRWHARDYGLLVANPFGSRAFGESDERRTEVRQASPLRLRWGVFVHDGSLADRHVDRMLTTDRGSSKTTASADPPPTATSAATAAASVDQMMRQLWVERDVTSAHLCSDSEFLRRATLDLNGIIPTVAQVRAFLSDTDKNKRARVVDRLLDSPRYATHMANTWRDILLPGEFDPAQLPLANELHRWLQEKFAANWRYDRLVAEFISVQDAEAIGPAVFYQVHDTDPAKLAAATSRIFLGVQIQCAQCHDHPFDDWSQQDFWGYAAFFARLRASQPNSDPLAFRLIDLTEGEVTLPDTEQVVLPRYPSRAAVDNRLGGTRRRQLAIWLASRDNPFLARAAVNRCWGQLFGRGLVDPVDDMGPNRPAVHPKLLERLSDEFIQSGFDLKSLWRTLVLSEVYQLSSEPGSSASSAGGQPASAEFFQRRLIRRLSPDQLYDSLRRSLLLPASGEFAADAQRIGFLQAMRTTEPDPTTYGLGMQQVLTLINGPPLTIALTDHDSGLLGSLQAPFLTVDDQIDILLLATLSRYPTGREREKFGNYLRTAANEAQGERPGDILWALLNSAEFQLNH